MLTLEKPWTRQPPYPSLLNKAHPLARVTLEYTRIDAGGIQTLSGARSVQFGAAAVESVIGKSGFGRRAATLSATQYESAVLSLKSWPYAFTLYARIMPAAPQGMLAPTFLQREFSMQYSLTVAVKVWVLAAREMGK